jgi:tRNA-splicing ligase RtcB (3'-phosphate/5'-hydroxy nucleic acid ligase)
MSTTAAAGSVRLERIDAHRWRIPRDPAIGMRVEGLVFADDELIEPLREDPCLTQVANVATLPGIVGSSLGMPDLHWGYGFPIGGVAAMAVDGGVISPGGIGFDINCGVRLLRSDLEENDVRPVLDRLADGLFRAVPSGVGAHSGLRLGTTEVEEVLRLGAGWAVAAGYGTEADLALTEEGGCMPDADPSQVSSRARARGAHQLGTLGSGNHFLEVQAVDRLLDPESARALGLREGQVTVMVHCGSRGLGHQVCTDHVGAMGRATLRYGISVPDRQLACAPLGSPEATEYLGAMAAAANFAWANRQLIAAAVRRSFADLFGPVAAALPLVYDVSHNMAKFERHVVDSREIDVCVHRKGATRAFPRGHAALPPAYREVGQPVLIPGDMGRCSMVAVGLPGAMAETFGSTCHGAGRRLSRHAALRMLRGTDLVEELRRAGVIVRAVRRDLLAEEASAAYKDVEQVVRVAAGAGHVQPVARLRPLAVIKG